MPQKISGRYKWRKKTYMRIGVRVRKNMLENIVFPLMLFLISFYDFSRGIDLTDAGYSIHRFEFFLDYSGADMISTFWSNILGFFFTKLPGGDTWYGLSFYCTWIIMICVLTGYFFVKKYMNYKIAALCEILAIFFCWAPNVILYDYLSFLLFQLGIIFVFKAIESDKKFWYTFAGFLLGMNVFVRIPNLTQCATIALVWFADWKNGKNLKQIIRDTLFCVIGYAVGIIFSVGVILYLYDFSELHMAIYNLTHTAQTVENYGILYMATATLAELIKYWKYIIILVLVLFIITFVDMSLIKEQKMRILTKISTGIMVLVLFAYWTKVDRILNFDYAWLNSILGLVCIFLFWGLIVSILNLFLEKTLKTKMLALTYIGVLYVTPLGSNTNVNLAMMNMFLLLPLGVYQIRLCGKCISQVEEKMEWQKAFRQIYQIITGTVACIMLFQSIQFGSHYIFRDTDECIVTDSNRIGGMHTSNERKEELQELITYFEEESLLGEYGILYCNAPGLAYILDLKPVLSSMWADWYTYSYDDFFAGIQKAEQLIVSDTEPVLLLSNLYSYYIEGNIQKMEEQGMNLYEVVKDDKYFRLVRFIEDNNYECSFRSKNYAVYRIEK